jgi:L-methionine (R)-S-oxide reductase
MPRHDELLQEFQGYVRSAGSAESLMEKIAQRLHHEMARYNWIGFYLVDKNEPRMLVVGPYVGSFSPNLKVRFDQGLCGAAATTGQTVLVHDVTADPRYLPGTDMVKSEIVVPIFVRGKFAAEFDVESYFANTFGRQDQEFVEACAALVGRYMETASA